MDITPPKNEKGTVALQLDNSKGEIHAAPAVASVPSTRSGETSHESNAAATSSRERRNGERRCKERRAVQSPSQRATMSQFDTRSGVERRHDERRAGSAVAGGAATQQIDTEI